MEEFDNNINYDVPDFKKPIIDIRYNVCPDCKIDMNENNNMLTCYICGYQKPYFDNKVEFSSRHSSPTENKISFKPSQQGKKKTFIVYPGYSVIKNGVIGREFNQLKYENTSMPEYIIDQAKVLYKKIVVDNNITKKTGKKEGIYQALIYLVCLKHNLPRTKLELSEKYNIPESKISEGLSFVKILNATYNLNLETDNKLIDGFINRFCIILEINITENLNKFFINMSKLIRDNHKLNMNKNPECIASSIILYGKDYFNYDVNIEQLSVLSYTSVKNIISYLKVLNKIDKDKANPFNPYFEKIKKAFVFKS